LSIGNKKSISETIKIELILYRKIIPLLYQCPNSNNILKIAPIKEGDNE